MIAVDEQRKAQSPIMLPAPAVMRTAALVLTVGMLLAIPGQPLQVPPPDTGSFRPLARTGPDSVPPSLLAPRAPGQPPAAVHATHVDLAEVVQGAAIPLPGSVYRNPIFERDEVVVPNINRTAVLIGDSQSEPPDGWPRQALAALGYQTYFVGLGGTGFVKANGRMGNYIDALERGDWLLPVGTPPLVVVQGGGNDAGSGATDVQITTNATKLIHALKSRYPATPIVMIGTLGRGAANGGGRRSQVDALLGTVAGQQGITFVSVGDWLTKFKLTHRLADSVHMNADGRKTLGVLLERRLRELNIKDLAATTGRMSARSEDERTTG